MIASLVQALGERARALRQRLASPTGRRVRTALAVFAALAALAGVGWQLYQGAEAVDWREIGRHWPQLLAAAGLVAISQLLGGVVWQLVLRGMGRSLSLSACVRIHVTSAIAKYVPGYAWQLMGKAYLTSQQDIPLRTVTVALGCEFGGLLLTALLVAGGLFPSVSLAELTAPIWLGPVVAILVALALAAAPWLLRLVTGRDALPAHPYRPQPLALWASFLVMILAWALLGLSTQCVVWSLGASVGGLWHQVTFAIALSFVVSLVVFFVPAGIGIREGVLTALLAPLVGGPGAAMVAILSRLTITLGEVLTFAGVWLVRAARNGGFMSITHRGDGKDSLFGEEGRDMGQK